MTTTTEDMAIATTILEQLGGRKACFMLGCLHGNEPYPVDRGLRMRPKGCRSINRITITLDADDTYTVRFHHASLSRKTFESKDVTRFEGSGFYADDLGRLITDKTGLYLSL